MSDDLMVVETAVWLVLICATIGLGAHWYRKQQVPPDWPEDEYR
jgi:hypothetical protein